VVSAADPAQSLIPFFYADALTFSFKYFLIYPHETEWTPFWGHSFSENFVAPEIEPGTFVSAARNSDH
jgi:hypothetical protein